MSNGMKEWYSPGELAKMKLPGLQDRADSISKYAAKQGWRERVTLAGTPLARERKASGGGWEYHYTVLPLDTQAALLKRHVNRKRGDRKTVARGTGEIWDWFERLPDKKKQEAERRLELVQAVEALMRGGYGKDLACTMIAHQHRDASKRTLYNWLDLIRGVQIPDRLPHLAPRHAGNSRALNITPEAWDYLCSDYLRVEKPSLRSCYERLKDVAAEKGWHVPPYDTLTKRIKKDIPVHALVVSREGVEGLKKLYPAQERDRSVFSAAEAVNADGHKFDVFVDWPGFDLPVRPIMTAIQDLYSGKMLAWRVDTSESMLTFRLAFGDLVETYGIPSVIYLDNGRGFVAKAMTGGVPHRFRGVVKEGEPLGVLPQLGVEVHFTTPYSGQSKPIERAFRDLCDTVAKHPAFAGAYTGNKPDAKPENYRSRAVPLDRFLEVLEEEMARHNARPGRRSAIAAGRSFDEVFNESYSRSAVRQATPEQRRLWLLMAESVKASSRDGTISLMGNRYWANFLTAERGGSVIVRFDPDALHDGVYVYRADGGFLGHAACLEKVGFNDTRAAKEHARARKDLIKGGKAMADAAKKLPAATVSDMLPKVLPADLPSPGATRLVHAALTKAERPRPVTPEQRLSPEQQAAVDALAAGNGGNLVPLFGERQPEPVASAPPPDSPEDRYDRALELEAAREQGFPLGEAEECWLQGYQDTPEYRTQAAMRRAFGSAQAG